MTDYLRRQQNREINAQFQEKRRRAYVELRASFQEDKDFAIEQYNEQRAELVTAEDFWKADARLKDKLRQINEDRAEAEMRLRERLDREYRELF